MLSNRTTKWWRIHALCFVLGLILTISSLALERTELRDNCRRFGCDGATVEPYPTSVRGWPLSMLPAPYPDEPGASVYLLVVIPFLTNVFSYYAAAIGLVLVVRKTARA